VFIPVCADSTSYPVYKLDDKTIQGSQKVKNKFIHIINKDDLKHFSTLEDALKQINGLNVRKISGLGSYSQLSYRGSNSDQINIYLDDVKLNSAGQTAVDVSKIPLNIIEKIIVDKDGMYSEPGGSEGVTSIYFITKKLGLASGSVTGRTGSFSRYELSGVYKGKFKNLAYQVNSSFQQAQNNFPYNSDNGTEWNKTDDGVRLRLNNQYQNLHTGGMLDWYFNTRGVASLSYKHLDYVKHYPGIYTDSGSTYTEYKDDIFSSNYLYTDKQAFISKIKISGELRLSTDNYTDPEETIGYRKYQLTRNTGTQSAGLLLELKPNKNFSLQPHYEFKREKSVAIDVNDFYPQSAAPPDADMTESKTSLKTIINLFDNSEIQINASVPWILFMSSKKDDLFSEELNFKKTFTNPSFSATVTWSPESGEQFLLKFARQNRFPGFREILGNNNNFRKNMDLAPEEIYVNTLSFKHNTFWLI